VRISKLVKIDISANTVQDRLRFAISFSNKGGGMRLTLLAQILVWLFSFSISVQAETFTFVVAENEPPLSSEFEDTAAGIIPDIIKLVFNYFPAHHLKLEVYPWARAQEQVKLGVADGLLTYPSKKRKEYASFTSIPAYKLDFGYLIYNKGSSSRYEIEHATSFQGLENIKIITQTGAEWESDNIPKYMHKVEANNLNTMIHLLLLRKDGDFLIMPPEQAIYLAKKFGYQHDVAYRHVDFINDSLIPFHIGVRQSHPLANELTSEVDVIVGSEKFRKQVQDIVDRYR